MKITGKSAILATNSWKLSMVLVCFIYCCAASWKPSVAMRLWPGTKYYSVRTSNLITFVLTTL